MSPLLLLNPWCIPEPPDDKSVKLQKTSKTLTVLSKSYNEISVPVNIQIVCLIFFIHFQQVSGKWSLFDCILDSQWYTARLLWVHMEAAICFKSKQVWLFSIKRLRALSYNINDMSSRRLKFAMEKEPKHLNMTINIAKVSSVGINKCLVLIWAPKMLCGAIAACQYEVSLKS